MGKGKKKGGGGGKQDEDTSVEAATSRLSLSESQPSTSQATEDESTSLSSSAARRKAKKALKAATKSELSAAAAESAEDPPPAPVPEPEPEPVHAKSEEKEMFGLGTSGGGGKKRPRKKKSAAAMEASAQAAAPTPTAVPATIVEQPAQEQGQGRGPPPPGLHPQQPGPQMVGPAQPGQPMAGQWQARPHQPGPPMTGQPQPGPPMAGQWQARPQQPGPPMAGQPQPGPPMGGQWQARPQQPGPPMAGQWQARPQQPGPPMAGQPQPGPPMARQYQPGPPQMQHPGPPVAAPQYPVPTRQQTPPQQVPSIMPAGDAPRASQSKTTCIFQVPKKIIGNCVMGVRNVSIITNYLQMSLSPKARYIHRYDVSFKPEKPTKMIPKVYNQVKAKHFPQELMAFDQMKNCYSLKLLPNVSKTERFTTDTDFTDSNGRVVKFEVSFKFTGTVDLKTIIDYMREGGTSLNPPTEAIQCIDVILRQGTLENYVKAGRQFFKRPNRPIDLGDGLEMWTGLFQSAIFTTQPFINIDVAHKGFPRQQPLVLAFQNDFRLDPTRPIETQRGFNSDAFISFVKGLKVVAYIGGNTGQGGQRREFIVNDLSPPPNKQKFTMEVNGKSKEVTVEEYFRTEKNCKLRYPNLNCVWVGPRNKNINYPMEFLEVAYGFARNRQLNEKQLSTMVRQAATPPDERKRKIEEVMKDMDYSRNPYFKQFGLEIANKFFAVDAKVLPAPSLEVGGGHVTPRNGAWQANRLLKAEALQRWALIAIEPDPRSDVNYGGILTMIKRCGINMGMAVSDPVMTSLNTNMRDLKNLLFKCLEKEVKFLFIIIPTRGRDYYHKVKQLAEREVGILTQCIREKTAGQRMNDQTVKNILLKVNSKLMGINQALDNRSMPACLRGGGVMVVGADVTHPSPDQVSVPSIAAVTASIDPTCFKYNIALSIQTPKKEMIVEFEDMMVEHLVLYRQRNGNLPKKIYVFRDGVSEGQFAQVMNSELMAVHKAYQRLMGHDAKPEVLFLLVQKRHHTRFFSAENSPRNVEPGTVVDKHIVHASELDFYLVSHQAIKGTARPTRYHAVCNDGNLKHDEVEQLTYYLCHLYSRCMRSVSYPTPTYYAHLACMRARSLTYDERFDNAQLERQPKRLHVLDKMLQNSRMFFV